MESLRIHRHRLAGFLVLFLVVAFIGFAYVKWWPYYNKALVAGSTHSIGAAIIANVGKTAVAPSISAGVSYSIAYFTAVWKAAVLGILIGSLVQVLIPTRWIVKVLGDKSMKGTLIAMACGIPTMMCTSVVRPQWRQDFTELRLQ